VNIVGCFMQFKDSVYDKRSQSVNQWKEKGNMMRTDSPLEK
jgi:hypothetical protein